MTTKEYLHQSNLTAIQLAELLGYKSTQMITKRMDEEMPERWVRKLDDLSDLGISPDLADAGENDNESEREPKITDSDINDWLHRERANDEDPNLNNTDTGNSVIGPQAIKLSTIRGYIMMIYSGAEELCKSRGDEVAAETIEKYKEELADAWIEYIKYDDRILKMLEQFQIGTPLGNLIGTHVLAMGAYVFARVTAKELANIAQNNGASGTGETEL